MSAMLIFGYAVLALLISLCIGAFIVGGRDDDWPK